MGFEGLGDNCEFGIVQRTFGAESLGLLRWATMYPDRLVSVLENRFEGVGDIDNTNVWVGSTGEYGTGDSRYFTMHTFISSHTISLEKMLPQMARRLKFLSAKLISDLEAAEKFFVYKRSDGLLSLEEARSIYRAARKYGPVKLLCVRKPLPGKLNRSVDQIDEGLFIGYLEALSKDPQQVHRYVEDWVAVCRQATALSMKS